MTNLCPIIYYIPSIIVICKSGAILFSSSDMSMPSIGSLISIGFNSISPSSFVCPKYWFCCLLMPSDISNPFCYWPLSWICILLSAGPNGVFDSFLILFWYCMPSPIPPELPSPLYDTMTTCGPPWALAYWLFRRWYSRMNCWYYWLFYYY